jgi:GH15 family glucan-1,4-alpha-glucosidase
MVLKALGERKAEEWRALRDRLHRQVCRRGFIRKFGSFVQSFDTNVLDASVLLLPIVSFLSLEDERVSSTADVIRRKLGKDGFIYRFAVQNRKDGESAFVACSFWMVHNLAGIGRRSEAEKLFERLIACRNDVGLLSEGYDPRKGSFMDNFPQALSHIALINAARMLCR